MSPWVYAKLEEMSRDGDSGAEALLGRADKEENTEPFEGEAFEYVTGKSGGKLFVEGGVSERKPKPTGKAVGTAGSKTSAEVYGDCRHAQERVSAALNSNEEYMRAVGEADAKAKQRGQIEMPQEELDEAVRFFLDNPYLGIDREGGADTLKHDHECVIIMGPAAAGKSSWIKKQEGLRQGYAVIDGDLYRNAVPQYSGSDTVTDAGNPFARYGFRTNEKGETVEDESRHDYSLVGCTQDISKAIKKKVYDQYTRDGTNFVWAIVGEDTDGTTDKIQDLLKKGYKVRVVLKNPPYQQTIAGTLKRARKVPTNVVSAGLRAPLSYRDNMDRFEGNPNVTFEEDNGTWVNKNEMEDYR